MHGLQRAGHGKGGQKLNDVTAGGADCTNTRTAKAPHQTPEMPPGPIGDEPPENGIRLMILLSRRLAQENTAQN